MGDELIETLQVFFDAGENRRETARRLHLADRTIAYRLERAEALLGHGFEGEAGRRLNVALTLQRLAAAAAFMLDSWPSRGTSPFDANRWHISAWPVPELDSCCRVK